ncbi:hypothetical protein F4806DRAFT_81926 [Annulohypoxylon nitens]|nr:hypothetical protein F4806DRAFT_81926 [Annulohypoxylon nitens]
MLAQNVRATADLSRRLEQDLLFLIRRLIALTRCREGLLSTPKLLGIDCSLVGNFSYLSLFDTLWGMVRVSQTHFRVGNPQEPEQPRFGLRQFDWNAQLSGDGPCERTCCERNRCTYIRIHGCVYHFFYFLIFFSRFSPSRPQPSQPSSQKYRPVLMILGWF